MNRVRRITTKMSIGSAKAKAENIRRKVFKGKQTSLYLYDKFNDVVIGQIPVWNVYNLSPLSPDAPDHEFRIAQLGTVATKANLAKYNLIFNGQIFDVTVRKEPLGNAEILWSLKARPTGTTRMV